MYLTCWIDLTGQKRGWAQVHRTAILPPGDHAPGREDGGDVGVLRCLGVWLVVEGELVEVGCRAVAVEVDGRFCALVDDNASRLSATSAGESIGRMKSHTAARSAPSPPESPSRSLRAMLSDPRALVRATAAGSSTKAAAQRSVSCAMPRSGSGSGSARSSSASTIASAGAARVGRYRRRAAGALGRSTRRHRRSAHGSGGRAGGRRSG